MQILSTQPPQCANKQNRESPQYECISPFTPSTPGSQVPCSPLHQVRGGVSPSRVNATKTRGSRPQATIEQNRRELVAFCQQSWQFTNFRHNKGEIAVLPLMVRLLIDTSRTAEHQPGRSRGELISQEIKKYVAMCLKPGESTGPDRCPNELTKNDDGRGFPNCENLREWHFDRRHKSTASDDESTIRSFTNTEARIKRWTNDQ